MNIAFAFRNFLIAGLRLAMFHLRRRMRVGP